MNSDGLLIAKSTEEHLLLPHMANRHGLISGATGTGKTVSLQLLAEHFSHIGVPVFLADVKGDLSGIGVSGTLTSKLTDRLNRLKLDTPAFEGCPVEFWDIYGKSGHPVRTTISEMGAILLSRLLNLNETQSSVLTMIFKIADDNGLLLLDLKDLKSMVQFVGDNAREFTTQYGNVSAASIGAIQRALLEIESSGGDIFFGEPALNLDDFMQTDRMGRGIINILAADQLILSPKIYTTFLLWLLSELFERLPEAGDLPKPKLVFFFDEAHLLFKDTSPVLQEKIEQVVRLIRSKGVGVFFVTQSPLDIPDAVLGQLGNRIQHALRAFTPKDQKVVRAAAQTFRANPDLDVERVLTELEVGEALVSFLDPKGAPSVVHRAHIAAPRSQIGPIPVDTRASIVRGSPLNRYYSASVDRESAYEVLKARAEQQAREEMATQQSMRTQAQVPQQPRISQPRPSQRQGVMEAFVKSAVRTAGNQIGRSLIRGILGSLLGGGRRR